MARLRPGLAIAAFSLACALVVACENTIATRPHMPRGTDLAASGGGGCSNSVGEPLSGDSTGHVKLTGGCGFKHLTLANVTLSGLIQMAPHPGNTQKPTAVGPAGRNNSLSGQCDGMLTAYAKGNGQGITPPDCSNGALGYSDSASFTRYQSNLLGDIYMGRAKFYDTSWNYSGTNMVSVAPVKASLGLTAAPKDIFAGTPVLGSGTITPPSVKDAGGTFTVPFDSVAWTYSADTGNPCTSNPTALQCTLAPQQSGTVKVAAYVNDVLQNKSAPVTVHCPPDTANEQSTDSLIRHSIKLREALDSLYKLGLRDNLEHLANLYSTPSGDTVLYPGGNVTHPTSCSVRINDPNVPSNWKLLGYAHNHPDAIPNGPCTNFNGPGAGTWFPSDSDQIAASRKGVPIYIVSADGASEEVRNMIMDLNRWLRKSGSCVFP